jgi:hypothetical protein
MKYSMPRTAQILRFVNDRRNEQGHILSGYNKVKLRGIKN